MASSAFKYEFLAKVLTFGLPRCIWYKVAYAVSGLLAHWNIRQNDQYKNTLTINHARKLNRLLGLMTRRGKAFPIPIRAYGLSLFARPRPNGLILCSTHLPLVKLAISYLAERSFVSMVAIASDPGVTNTIALWGSEKRLSALPADRIVLQKAKTVLQRGGTIVVLVDKVLGGAYSPNIFRLAQKLRSDIVFFEAVLDHNKTVEVNFYESKLNGESDCVQRQMSELYQHTASVLAKQYDSEYLHSPC